MRVPGGDQQLPGAGERVSLHVVADGGASDVVGFAVSVDERAIEVQDRHGGVRSVPWDAVAAWRRVPVSRGRNPLATPRWLLDELAGRTGASGDAWVARISDLLAARRPPAAVPPPGEWVTLDGVRARLEGEWVTLGGGSPEVWVAAAWWATRMGARSVLVVSSDPGVGASLADSGFVRLP